MPTKASNNGKAPAPSTNGHKPAAEAQATFDPSKMPDYVKNADIGAELFTAQRPTSFPRELLTPGDKKEELYMRTFLMPEEHNRYVRLFAMDRFLQTGKVTLEEVIRFDMSLRPSWWGRSREIAADMYTRIRTAQNSGPMGWLRRALNLREAPKDREDVQQ